MSKILILIGAHLCTAPRPQKEADILAAAGHEVVVRGVWFDPGLVERDRQIIAQKPWRFQPVLDFRPCHWFTNRWVRLTRKLARQQFQRRGQPVPDLFGYGARAMLKAALQEQADLTIVHSEAGLWVGSHLLQRAWRVGVDFEDWFSEDLLPAALLTRPIHALKGLEATLMQHCAYRLTTSHALAATLSTVYQAPPPTVIYNLFPATNSSLQVLSPRATTVARLHWFSQTIGPGRGLETLFQALPALHLPVEIHLRGHYPDHARQWLEPQIPERWRDRVFVHPTVPNDELPARIAEHDIGLALEQPDPPSRNLTITNKLFQYLQAGLAVIATDTAGQREVFQQCPPIGHLIPAQNPLALAAAITDLIQHPHLLQTAKQAARQALTQQFSWDHQCDRLLQAAEHALRS
ncbi:glycosyltransferase family protein [Pantanalinema rosaneae CENA516]|uniref:glycosyltransferase family protein n=1 Tax=Pantanalinema rosaneae TaxID=1620701 RepID=UPI003D6E1F32